MTDRWELNHSRMEDIADNLQELRSIVYLFSMIGETKTCIHPDALAHVFGFIEAEIKKTQDAIYSLCDRMRSPGKEVETVCQAEKTTTCYTGLPGKPGQPTR